MSEEIIIENDEQKPPRSWDFFLTVFLLFLLLVLTGIFLVLGLGLSVSALGCADSADDCNGIAFSAGTLLATAGTAVVALAGFVTTIVFIARRRMSFLVPLITCLAVVGLFFVGSWLVRVAVP
jgi:hypothetical protein